MSEDIPDKGIKSGVTAILATAIVVFAFILFYALLFRNIQGSSKDIILFVLGAVSTNLTQVVSYYFGSSKGADEKTRIISNITRDNNRTAI
jgi:hypothetical protein